MTTNFTIQVLYARRFRDGSLAPTVVRTQTINANDTMQAMDMALHSARRNYGLTAEDKVETRVIR